MRVGVLEAVEEGEEVRVLVGVRELVPVPVCVRV